MVGKVLCVLFAVLVCGAMAQFTAKKMHELTRMGDYAISDKDGIFYSSSVWDGATNKTSTSIYGQGIGYLVPVSNNRVSSPMFMPGNVEILFYLSNEGGETNMWYTPVKGAPGQRTALSNFPISISNAKVTPGYIMFTADVYDTCGTDFTCTAERDAWVSQNPNRGIAFDELFVRHWDEIVLPGKSSVLFTQQIETTPTGFKLVGPVNQISLTNLNVPTPPDGGIEQIDISPDFSSIAYTGASINKMQALNTGWGIHEATVFPNNGSLRSDICITCAKFTNIRTTNPRYNPQNTILSFMAMDRPGFEADRFHLVLMNRPPFSANSNDKKDSNLKFEKLTPIGPAGWALSVSEFIWTVDGATIILAADEDGEHRLYSMNFQTSVVKRLFNDGNNLNLFVSLTNRIYFSHSTFNSAANLWFMVWDDTQPSAPSGPYTAARFNSGALFEELVAPTKFYYPSRDGAQVQGWFFKPRGWQPNVKYPFVLLIHGGPQGAWTSAWSYRWNPQLWSQHGYAVAMINPHGSTGFGQPYCDAVSGNWGGLPFQDLMDGVDRLLTNHTWIDPSRIAACGASYGGFMINWIQGNAPTRFSSLVVHDGLFDIPISYGATDELWFPEWEFKGTPWDNPAGYQKWNPANFASNWQTPMLVVHGGKDYRVDLAHGLAAFTTLQRKNIPSKFLFYPLENHWVTKPSNSVQWYSEVLGWLDTYTKRNATH